jgi:hypothetical protein
LSKFATQRLVIPAGGRGLLQLREGISAVD